MDNVLFDLIGKDPSNCRLFLNGIDENDEESIKELDCSGSDISTTLKKEIRNFKNREERQQPVF